MPHVHILSTATHQLQLINAGECGRNRHYMAASCERSCGGCASWDWLYELRLGMLHRTLACWERPVGGASPDGNCGSLRKPWWTPCAHSSSCEALRSVADLWGLPASSLAGLRALAGPAGAKWLDAALRQRNEAKEEL